MPRTWQTYGRLGSLEPAVCRCDGLPVGARGVRSDVGSQPEVLSPLRRITSRYQVALSFGMRCCVS